MAITFVNAVKFNGSFYMLFKLMFNGDVYTCSSVRPTPYQSYHNDEDQPVYSRI